MGIPLSNEIIKFFLRLHSVVVNTIDKDGNIHSSIKDIIDIDREGVVYILDLYQRNTFSNLKEDPLITITGVDAERFQGYALQGKARVVEGDGIDKRILKLWEAKLVSKLSKRLIENVRKGYKKAQHPVYPEALFPKPQYLIKMEVERLIDLTPSHIAMGKPHKAKGA